MTGATAHQACVEPTDPLISESIVHAIASAALDFAMAETGRQSRTAHGDAE